MQDTNICPICERKMRTVTINSRLEFIEKEAFFLERTCSGPNHSIQIFTDKKTGSVDMLRFSLDPKYSRFLEIDFINNRCRAHCMKESKADSYIYIPKIVELDFPNLEKLKERISIYVTFS